MFQTLFRALLVVVLMLSGMGESLHAFGLFEHHHAESCTLVSAHFDSVDQAGDRDCPVCHLSLASHDYLFAQSFQFHQADVSSRLTWDALILEKTVIELLNARGPPAV